MPSRMGPGIAVLEAAAIYFHFVQRVFNLTSRHRLRAWFR
jgi:hypothetical protein